MRVLCRRRAESPGADAEAEKKRARLEKLAAWRSKQSGAAGGEAGVPAGGEPGAQDARAQPQEPRQAQAPAQAQADPPQQGKPEVWCVPRPCEATTQSPRVAAQCSSVEAGGFRAAGSSKA